MVYNTATDARVSMYNRETGPNATTQPLPEAGARNERTLEGVGCSRWFGLVAPPACPESPTQAALVMALCRTLKDRHDLRQTTLGKIPQHIGRAHVEVSGHNDP